MGYFSFFSAQSATQNAEKTGRKLGNQVGILTFWIECKLNKTFRPKLET